MRWPRRSRPRLEVPPEHRVAHLAVADPRCGYYLAKADPDRFRRVVDAYLAWRREADS